jgi:uncharacterized membrane protein
VPYYFPLAISLIAALLLVLAGLGLVVYLHVIEYAYASIGIPPRYMFLLLALSLLGSSINIPIWRVRGASVVTVPSISVFGVRWLIPEARHAQQTVVAVNVGGAIIPALICVWILSSTDVIGPAAVTVAVVAIVTHLFARVVPGLGIAVPTLLPAATAAATALALAPESAAAVGYIGGTMGTLIGADLLNLPHVRRLGAPLVSIGGAGTFDGVFLTGILAVLLA